MRKKKTIKKKPRNDTSSKAKKAVKKKAKSARKLTPRTRNAGTMTEAQFFQMIRAALRNKSRWWKPRMKCLEKARRTYVGPNKRQKWEFQCSVCNGWFLQSQVEAHHEIPAGKLNSFNDLPGFVERLFCETGFKCICKKCHKEEHEK